MRGKCLIVGCALAAGILCACSDSDESVVSAKSDKQETAGDFVANGLGFGSARARVETIVMEEGPDMLNYGHINLTVPADTFLKTFEYGDIVTVMVNGYDTIVAPVVGNYDDVSSGEYLVRVAKGKKYITLSINYGQIGVGLGSSREPWENLKIAKDSEGAAATPYILNGDVVLPIHVIIEMKEKGGYLENLKMREIQSQGLSREEYPDLTDGEFANFRMVATTGMGEGRLFRSSSPVDPSLGRNAFVDSLARSANVKVFLNLTDTKSGAEGYDGFGESYYASQDVIYLGLPAAFTSNAFKEGFVKGLRYMIDNEGPYLVHCREGKDRAGYVAAVLEALMGASLAEIKEDYAKTYTNYYNVQDGKQIKLTEEQKDWFAKIIVQNLRLSYAAEGVEFDDFETADMQAVTEDYLGKLGLSAGEIASLKNRLSD